MNRCTIILFIVLLFTFFGCEKEIVLNLGDYRPKIVMNGIISADSIIEIKVSKSFLYTDTFSTNSLLKNASLTLFINGEEREKLKITDVDTRPDTDWNGNPYTAMTSLFRSTVTPKIGDRIRIEAIAEGLNPVWAETTIPLPPQINRIDTATFFTSKKIITNEFGHHGPPLAENVEQEDLYRNMRIKIGIAGSSLEPKQYYLIRLRLWNSYSTEYTDEWDNHLYLYTKDDLIFDENIHNNFLEDLIVGEDFHEEMKNNRFAIFSNKLFRDNKYTLDISITDYYTIHTEYDFSETVKPIKTEVSHDPIRVECMAISPELYPYMWYNAYGNHDIDEDNLAMISEPEITHSNVHNGIGIVGSTSSTRSVFEIEPFPGGENKVPKSY